nr:MAG TPA: hypothetical protein [Caudoviricetes sp.]
MFLFWGCMMEEEYRKAIIKMVKEIRDIGILKQIYTYIKVKKK